MCQGRCEDVTGDQRPVEEEEVKRKNGFEAELPGKN
jgi:hypothetical protein